MKPVPVLLACIFAAAASTLTAQQPGAADPFVKGNIPAPAPPPATVEVPDLVRQGLVRTEYFSLPHTLARKMMRQFPQQPALYEWLGKELENPQSEVKLEHLSLLKVRSGQRSKLEEINEFPYPTEFDPPQIPQDYGSRPPQNGVGAAVPAPVPAPAPPTPPPAPESPGANGDPGTAGAPATPSSPDAGGSTPATKVAPPWPYNPTTPSAFTYKNTGWTLEVEMTIGEDGESVDLNLAPEHIKLISMLPQSANGEVLQPLFETHKLTTQILTKLGRPTLIGTISPPVATGAPGANETNRTWLLFITVNRAR